MKRQWKTFTASIALLLLVFGSLWAGGSSEDEVTITVLQTSDLHGTIAPWDYASDSELDYGLTKIATIVNQERKKDPNLLLIDSGDTIEANMVQEFRYDDIHPMMKAMNAMEFDAWIIGNHEFNFEFETLLDAIENSDAAVVAGNIYKQNGERFVEPYVIQDVKGVKVGIIGLTAPHVPQWEASNPERYDYMTFTMLEEEIVKILDEVEGKADVLIVVAHYGSDSEYGTAGMRELAERHGDRIDAFLIGHAHATISETLPNGTILLEPGSRGSDISKLVLNMEKVDGEWVVASKSGEIIPIKGENIATDPELAKLMNYVHEESRVISNTVVGQVGADFLPSLWWNDLEGIPTAIMQDTAMIDLINTVQMEETGADVSLAALFDTTSNLVEGDFRKRDGVKIYKYDNTLMAVTITGKQLKEIIEVRAGNFFNEYKDGDVTISVNPDIRLYNYDMFAGVDYDINISNPVGSRIENVMFNGSPLANDEELVLAMNNYRYGGLSGAGLISADPDKLVYNSGLAIRELIGDYVIEIGTIMPETDNNWRITGADLSHPETETVYELVREGKIQIPVSEDGRTPNVKALNVAELKAQGLL